MPAHDDKRKVCFYDTTLRDGAQMHGVNLSLLDKTTIAGWIDEIGIPYIEGGWPGATDTALFEMPLDMQAKLVAFGMTRQAKYRTAQEDPGLQTVLGAAQDVCLYGKCWDEHVIKSLEVSPDENLELVSSSFAEGRRLGKAMIFDAEHFFDGYKANRAYAIDCLHAADDEGASWLVLCDTRGAAMPEEVHRIVKKVKSGFPKARLGIHAHNDFGCAVANSRMAVLAGASMVQGTLYGIGERAGNADLFTLIPMLGEAYDTGISKQQVSKLTGIGNSLCELLDIQADPRKPVVGERAFCHEAGTHQKTPQHYELFPAETVGNERTMPVSNQTGSHNVVRLLRGGGYARDKNDPQVRHIVSLVKQKEREGYAFELAPGSFWLLAKSVLDPEPLPFSLIDYEVLAKARFSGRGKDMMKANVTVCAEGKTVTETAAGNGPVNALDIALHKALDPHFPEAGKARLSKYLVRSLDAANGTEARIRVCVEMTCPETDKAWRTMGVSTDLLKASMEALCHGLEYQHFFVNKRRPVRPSLSCAL